MVAGEPYQKALSKLRCTEAAGWATDKPGDAGIKDKHV